MSWEPVPVPDRYLEPPEPEEEFCEVCEKDVDDCECEFCVDCDEPATETVTVDGDTYPACIECAEQYTEEEKWSAE